MSDISLNISEGEKVAILGESGVGKSSLLEVLRKQLPEDIAFAPQSDALVDTLSVFHNLYMGALHRHSALHNLVNLIAPRTLEKTELKILASELNLQDHLWAPVSQLSGGQVRRVIVGRALYQKRRIFIGDEITSGLDFVQAESMFQLIAKTHDTLLLALHNIDFALKHCTRIIALKDQCIVIDAASEGLQKKDLASIFNSEKLLS